MVTSVRGPLNVMAIKYQPSGSDIPDFSSKTSKTGTPMDEKSRKVRPDAFQQRALNVLFPPLQKSGCDFTILRMLSLVENMHTFVSC